MDERSTNESRTEVHGRMSDDRQSVDKRAVNRSWTEVRARTKVGQRLVVTAAMAALPLGMLQRNDGLAGAALRRDGGVGCTTLVELVELVAQC